MGRKTCRGIDINNGSTVWTLETGVPSGLGVASENIYYLPIKESNGSKEPEVCAIDIAKGKIVAHTRSRKSEVAGNLIFHEGAVISQTTSDVAVYPQLAIKLEQIDLLIKANPNDPLGLTERGELRLNKGDLKGAIEDLKKYLHKASLRKSKTGPALSCLNLSLITSSRISMQQSHSLGNMRHYAK